MENPAKLVAFLSMEYAIEKELPIYAGGLGVLAADYVLEAGKLNPSDGLSYAFLGLFYQDHLITTPKDSGFVILKDENAEPIWLDIDIAVRPIFAQVWVKAYGTTKLYLFDTNVSSNEPEAKDITKNLYDSDSTVFLKQQMVLAIGAVKLFQRLNLRPDVFHLNEGHTGMTILALAVDYLDSHPEASWQDALAATREKVVGTKHTILHGAGRDIPSDQFNDVLGQYFKRHKRDSAEAFNSGVNQKTGMFFSTTYFLMAHVRAANCVSKLHCEFEKGVHPTSMLQPITNGVQTDRWQAENIRSSSGSSLTDEELWKCHQENKQAMFKFLNLNLNLNYLTLVWARRLATYKRPLLLFKDLDRLTRLVANDDHPVQIVISGRANGADPESMAFAKELARISELPQFKKRIVFIPEYSLNVTQPLTSGADVWVNTPVVGQEACGTSGMKAGLNGVLLLSTPDGWMGEVDWENICWTCPEENIEERIYSNLENEIVPTYYNQESGTPKKWVDRMRKTMKIVEEGYTSKRMLKDYVEKLYFPS